jgi:hypothetical protein
MGTDRDLRELIEPATAGLTVFSAACVLTLAPLIAATVLGALRGNMKRRIAGAMFVALAGPALLIMWTVYNFIIGQWGLDSTRALPMNLAVFVIAGAALGLAARRLRHRLGLP